MPLTPRDPEGRVYLIDRQLFGWNLPVWIGASDLAYMMLHWWPCSVRCWVETVIIRRWHEELLQRGVQNYRFDQAWDDYRLTAMQSLYVVANWLSNETDRSEMRWVWKPQLEKTLAAIHDLQCVTLL